MSLLNAVDRRLVIALLALFTVIIGSTVILRLAFRLAGGHHIPLVDAAYFTVETVTTVGYGDFSFRSQSPWLIGGAIC